MSPHAQSEEREFVQAFRAALDGDVPTLKKIIQHSKITGLYLYRHKDFGLLLHGCVSKRPYDSKAALRLKAASFLLQYDADRGFKYNLSTAWNGKGRGLIHAIADASDINFLLQLLGHCADFPNYSLDINALSKDLMTPLHIASLNASPDIVSVLYLNGAILSKSGGKTALDMILERLNSEDDDNGLYNNDYYLRLEEVRSLLTVIAAFRKLEKEERKKAAAAKREGKKLEEAQKMQAGRNNLREKDKLKARMEKLASLIEQQEKKNLSKGPKIIRNNLS